MSVINKMLNDLDKRQAATAPRARPSSVRHGTSRTMWIGLVVAVLIFLIFGLPQYQKKPPRLRDTPGNQAPTTFVLRPGEPAAASPETTPASTSVPALANSVAVDPKSATDVSSHVARSDTQPAAPSTTTASQAVSSVQPNVVTAEPVTDHLHSSSMQSSQQTAALPNNLTAVELPPLVETAANNTMQQNTTGAATFPEKPAVAALDPSLNFPSLANQTADISRSNPRAELKIERVGPAPTLPSSVIQQANNAMQAGNWPLAQQLWQQVLQQQPNDVLAYEQLAQLYASDTRALSQLLEQARQRGVQSLLLQQAQLRLYAARKEWPLLLAALTPELEQQGGAVLSLKAQAQQQLGQADAALHTYQQWQQLEPQQARAFLGEALLHDQLGHGAAARQAYQQALERGGLAESTMTFIQQRLEQQGAE